MEDSYVLQVRERQFSDLYLCFCGYAQCRPRHSFGPAVRPNYIIHYILRGKGSYSVGGTRFELEAGQGFLIEPGVQTFYQADQEEPWTYLWVGFDGERAAEYLQTALHDRGVGDAAIFDVSKTHFSYIISEIFAKSHVVLASVTYNAGIFTTMETLISEIVRHDIRGRKFSFIENGSWAAQSGKLMREELSLLKDVAFIGETVSFRSTPKQETFEQLDKLASDIAADIKK